MQRQCGFARGFRPVNFDHAPARQAANSQSNIETERAGGNRVRMIEPLPKLRSIWESAASRAFDLSMENPSTRRSAMAIASLLMTGIRRTDKRSVRRREGSVHDLFSVRNMRIYPLTAFMGCAHVGS
jgi:hypothetical protein